MVTTICYMMVKRKGRRIEAKFFFFFKKSFHIQPFIAVKCEYAIRFYADTHTQVIIPFCNASHKINMMRYLSCAKSIILFAIRTPFIYSVWSFWSLNHFFRSLRVVRLRSVGLFSDYSKMLWRANDAIFN